MSSFFKILKYWLCTYLFYIGGGGRIYFHVIMTGSSDTDRNEGRAPYPSTPGHISETVSIRLWMTFVRVLWPLLGLLLFGVSQNKVRPVLARRDEAELGMRQMGCG